MKEDLVELLASHGQEHLLAFWDELDGSRRESLATEIRKVDFAAIARVFADRDNRVEVLASIGRAADPPAFRLDSTNDCFSSEEARKRGAEALANGEVGVILVAGGQGTRLGFDHPKGMFPIGPVSENSLFQIHVEKILAARRRYGKPIPLCLMTSLATDEETRRFFDRNDRFGLPEDELTIFQQGTMPAVDTKTGKLLLAQRDRLALSPDGHGGMLRALESSGALDDLEARRIKSLFYLQVDNPLVEICSPEFIGYHLLSESELSSQVVAKRTPWDRVGNVIQIDGRLWVVEYSDLPNELAQRRRPDGSLEIWAGSIAVHIMDVAFLRRMFGSRDALPFHVANKKVTYVDPSGKRIEPQTPNALKFERFIFDLLPLAANATVVEMDRKWCFAPLKNGAGATEDTPELVKSQMVQLATEWLHKAGATVFSGVNVEISPLYALDANELKERINPGTLVNEKKYFR
jgi:UDP-N-acetylglucosamine/UDP-N-acetylgalactosamine diphosphorylase